MSETKPITKPSRPDTFNYWEQLKRLEKLNRSSEVKAGVIFSFHSLVLGLFAEKIDFFKELLTNHILIIIILVLWLIATIISIFYCFKTFKPIIIKTKYDDNVFFFGDVVNKFGSVEDYVKTVIKVTSNNKNLFKQLAQQLHVESTIVTEKFKSVQKCIKFFALSILFIILILAIIVLI